MKSINIVLEYDPRGGAAYLRVMPTPKAASAAHTIGVTPPGLPEALGVDPNDSSIQLRMDFSADGRLHGVEFLMPESQLPIELLSELASE